MADGRMLKKKISLDAAWADLENDTHRMMYETGIAHLDIEGRISGEPREFKAAVVPMLDHITKEKVLKFFTDAEKVGLIIRYKVEKKWIVQYPGFKKNQSLRPDKEAPSVYPPLPDNYGSSPGVVPEVDGITPAEVKRREVKGKEENIIASPDNGDALPTATPVPFYACKHFELDNDFITKLLQEYPALNQETITAEISKAHDWLDDNPDRHKRRANGHLKNPRTFLKNWLNRAVINPKGQQKGFQGKGIMAWASRQEDL